MAVGNGLKDPAKYEKWLGEQIANHFIPRPMPEHLALVEPETAILEGIKVGDTTYRSER